MSEFDLIYKYILIGDTMVGKSSILSQFITKKFQIKKPTIGIDFNSKIIKISKKKIKIQIWDTSGQENFRALTKLYFKKFFKKYKRSIISF